MPYSAGTVILQVVPSYVGFQEANRKQAQDIADALDHGLDEGTKSGAKKARKNIDDVLGKGMDDAGKEAGEKYAGKFRTELQNAMKGLHRELDPLELRINDEGLRSAFERAKAEAKALGKIKIKPGMDTTEIELRAAEVRRILRDLRENVDIRARMDIDAAAAAADRLDEKLTKLRKSATIDADMNTETIERKIGYLEKTLKDKLSKAADALGDGVSKELDKIKARMSTLSNKRIGIDISAEDAIREAKELQHELEMLAALSPDIQIHTDAKRASAELKGFERELTKLDGKNVSPDVKIKNADQAERKLSLLDRLLGKLGVDGRDVANSFRFFSFAALGAAGAGAALIPVVAALSGAFIALGVAMGALVLGGVILAAAFSGIGDAVGALNDQQDNAAKDAQANAKHMKSAARQVEDAERSLARARADSAQAAKDAAQSVKDAEESAARSLETSLQRQQDAQERYNETVQNSIDAQKALVDARKQAAKDLQDLDDQRKKNALDERQAVIDLFNATVADTAARQDPGATNLEKEQAAINLGNAQLRLKEIRDQGKELKDQQSEGIKGNEKVKTAEERVTDAIKAQQKARQDVADAEKELARTRVDNARQIADAEEAQRRSAADNLQRIEDATRNLSEAQEDYKFALTDTSTVGRESFQKVQDAMGKLSPAGREFALFIHSLRDDFYELRGLIQEGFLPGLQQGMELIIKTYGPDFKRFVSDIAQLFGKLAVDLAKLLTGPTFKQLFAVLAAMTPKIIETFFKTFVVWMQIFANVAIAFAPLALQISEFILDISESILKWMQSKAGQDAIADFLAYLKEVGPDVAKFLFALASAFVAIVTALAPYGDMLLGILTSFLNWIAGMDPETLGTLLVGILGLVTAFQALAGIISLLSVIAGSTLGPIVLAIFAVIAALVYFYNTNEDVRKILDTVWKAIVPVIKWAFDSWVQYIGAVAALLVWLGGKVKEVWEKWIWPFLKDFGDVVGWVWNKIISPVFNAIGKIVSEVFTGLAWSWNNVAGPIFKVIGQIVWELWEKTFSVAFKLIGEAFGALGTGLKWTWENVIFPVIKFLANAMGIDIENGKELKQGLVAVFHGAMAGIGRAWDKMKDLAKKPIKFVLETVFNNGLIKGFNWLADKLHMDKVDPIPIPEGFANGGIPFGVRPGYTPGRDTHMINVGGGEAILRPELTRALGSDWVYAANRRAKDGGVGGARRFLQGFKDGGVFWPIPGRSVGTPFGKKGPMWSSGYHTGTDFPAPIGTPIHAVMDGRVSSTAWSSWGGNLTRIITKGLGEWFYAHQSGRIVKNGDQVSGNQIIGYVGDTGNVTGPHLHLELRVGGRAVDPMRTLLGGAVGVGEKEEPQKDDRSRLEKILGGLGKAAGAVKDAISSPLNWLKGKVEGPINAMKKQFGESWLTQNLAKLPQQFFSSLVDRIKGIVGADDGGEDLGQWKGATSDLQRMVQDMAAQKFGWSGGQWAALNWLVSHESSWNPNAQNPTSTAYGLFQFLDGTWKGYGSKTSDPAKQALYGMQYIKDRYGDPAKAKAFWEAHHWYADGGVVGEGAGQPTGGLPDNGTMMYDNGGYLPPGVTTVVNLTGKPEPVFTAAQFEGMRAGDSGGLHYEPHFYNSDLTADDVMDDFRFEVRRLGRGS